MLVSTLLLDHIKRALLTPSWPINISNIIDILHIGVSDVVIPKESPLTPNALQDSKKASKKLTVFRFVTMIVVTAKTRT